MTPTTLIGLDLDELQEILGGAQPAYRSRQLYRALYRQRVGAFDEITTLPSDTRDALRDSATLGLPVPRQRFESQDGTRRYLLGLHDDKTVEAVLMPEEERDTICISTQVGCPVDCKFCLTALMGLERNLTGGEIVGQVFHIVSDNQLDPAAGRLNIVMMGQGEPLLNLPNVLKATRLLTDPDGCGLSEKRITLSTAGMIPQIAELGQTEPRPKLAISLNASNEEQRR